MTNAIVEDDLAGVSFVSTRGFSDTLAIIGRQNRRHLYRLDLPPKPPQAPALRQRRLASDWPRRFGHRVWLMETFVDPSRFTDTVHRAANWHCVGYTRGFRRIGSGYGTQPPTPRSSSSCARSAPTRLRRFAIGLTRAKSDSVASTP